MNQNITRSSKKHKTSILFEVKHNTEKPVEVGQSLNIIALRKGNLSKLPSQPEQPGSNKSGLVDNYFKNQKNSKQNRSPKISIQLKNGSLFDEISENKNKQKYSIKNQFSGCYKNNYIWSKQQPSDIVEKLRKEYRIIIDKEKGKLTCHIDQFSSLCNDFMTKISGLQEEKSSMITKLQRYKSYFKQLKAKQTTESPQNDRNQQLKILNLERKIQTQNYIIKNYRTNNKEELKNFEKKINQYKPNLEEDLVKMLADANSKNQELQAQINYFQKECEKYYKNGNWVQIVRKMQEKDVIIDKLEVTIKQLSRNLNENQEKQKQFQALKSKCSQVNQKNCILEKKITSLRLEYENMKKLKCSQEIEYEELIRTHQQLNFKYEGLVALEVKILQKEDLLKKNSLSLARLQDQNYCLKAKIETLNRHQNNEFFGNGCSYVDKIEQLNSQINDLSNRFQEQIQNKSLKQDKSHSSHLQFLSFITHIFQKVKGSYESIINEFRKRIQEFSLQNKKFKSILEGLHESNKKKLSEKQKILEQMQTNFNKRIRCVEGVQKFNSISISVHIDNKCSACKNWMLHWGQLNSLYENLFAMVQRIRQA